MQFYASAFQKSHFKAEKNHCLVNWLLFITLQFQTAFSSCTLTLVSFPFLLDPQYNDRAVICFW